MTANEAIGVIGDGSISAAAARALAAWARDPALARPLADPAGAHLVLDGAAERVLHASAAARALAGGIADADGLLRSDLGLSRSIREAGASGAPRLMRLRLDPRRIAPPTPCVIVGGEDDVLLLLVAGPLPVLKPRAATAPRPPVATAPGKPPTRPVPQDQSTDASVGARFVWRSDAADVIVALTGPGAAVLEPILVGRSWAELAERGLLLEAEDLLAVLARRDTFRAVPAVLRLDAPAGRIAVAWSGARLGRSGEAFSGHGGYGLVQAVIAAETATVSSRDGEPSPGPDIRPLPDDDAGAPAADHVTLPDARLAAWPPMPEPEFDVVSAPAGDSIGDSAHGNGDEPEAHAEQPAPETALSVTEHAAFREIARALNARYAGDDDPASPVAPGDAARTESSVMPFPGLRAVDAPASDPARTSANAEMQALLDGVPAPILIHRGDAILAANRALLDLTGYVDLPALARGGLGRVFRGVPPDRRRAHHAAADAAPWTALVETAAGASRPVAVARADSTWMGHAAACLMLQALPEADAAGARTAERLAQQVRDGHAADARRTLDTIEDAIVALDGESRIVAMNRAGAVLFACDPREVVGTAFEHLFEADARDAVRAGLEGLGREIPVVARTTGLALVLRVSGAGSAPVAVLRRADPAAGARIAAVDAIDPSALLARLDREIGAPITEIVARTERLLAEGTGSGEVRDGAALRGIQATAERVLGLVADLRELATLEGGGRPVAPRPLPLNDLVSGCVSLLQPEAARRRIVLRTSFSPDIAVLEADEPTLRQAALTVIANAIRYTAAGGQVIVSTMPSDRGGVALKVRDTGPGMSPDEIASALEPLRASSGGARRTGGNGLGLPLTRALVEANHGHLRITSRKDEGTLVEILLPAARALSA